MPRLRALDLFCGGGGTALGLMEAGFEVTGIDHARRHAKTYPGRFIEADALAPPVRLLDYDFVWASPPCQRYSQGNNMNPGARKTKPDLIERTRALLTEHPFTVIENVPGAPIRADCILTGPMVGLPKLRRKRFFETSFYLLQPPIEMPTGSMAEGTLVSPTRNGTPTREVRAQRVQNGLSPYWTVDEMREAMALPKNFTREQIGEAVPPPYARFIARAALAAGCGR